MSRALVLGGTGETGKRVVEQLRINDLISKVVMITRRQVELPDGPGIEKVEQKMVDFDKLEESKDAFSNVDMAFCCLGTTRGKAGKEGFVKVDLDYVVNSAKLLKDNGDCKEFHLVSSKGANPNGWFLYPQIKGQAEDAVKAMGFNYVSVFRPGLLITGRDETRVGEKLAQSLAGVLDRSNKCSIKVEDVAKAMIVNATKRTSSEKIETFEHWQILEMAKTCE